MHPALKSRANSRPIKPGGRTRLRARPLQLIRPLENARIVPETGAAAPAFAGPRRVTPPCSDAPGPQRSYSAFSTAPWLPDVTILE
jgi:hypothetical protein